MNYLNPIILLGLVSFLSVNAQNKTLFFQTNWGYEGSWAEFFEDVKQSGYEGIEVWLPSDPKIQDTLIMGLKAHDLKVIYLCGTNRSQHFEQSLIDYQNQLTRAIAQKPYAINSHTGSEFFSFEQNQAFISIANELSIQHKIPIFHETHRGRFSYSLPETLRYLENDTLFRINLDVSHWMVVHESLLIEQQKPLDAVLNRTEHVHARVGFEEGPQVNDPQAPEWKKALERHLNLWETIAKRQWASGKEMTITTEFGPPNYMPTTPYTRKALSDQWKANVFIRNAIKLRFYSNQNQK